ncbi:MAG TPA: protein kinase, partial [Polyangiaceae bacterium]|nr:protein kinase [Polyangiaceae bacterium]
MKLAATMPEKGALVSGKYRIIRLLGRGGMGAVYEAEHTLSYKRVAIKWVRPEYLDDADAMERLLREARACCRVRHPNIIDLYDVVREDGVLFLVMEYLEGEPLRQTMLRGNLPQHRLLELILQAMRGAHAAHRASIVHRDIKPDNIFVALQADGSPAIAKLLDFGISKIAAEGTSTTLTTTGVAIGTPLYMSYEQLRGERDLDGRADVYAFGVMLYEALTGVPPFRADSIAELAVKIATTEPVPPRQLCSTIAPELEGLILRAMSKNRDARIQLPRLIEGLLPYTRPIAGSEWDRDAFPRVRTEPRPLQTGSDRLPPVPTLANSTIGKVSSNPFARPKRRAGPWLWLGIALLSGLLGIWGAISVMKPVSEPSRAKQDLAPDARSPMAGAAPYAAPDPQQEHVAAPSPAVREEEEPTAADDALDSPTVAQPPPGAKLRMGSQVFSSSRRSTRQAGLSKQRPAPVDEPKTST